MELLTGLLIYKIILSIANIVLITFFLEMLIKKFLPKKINYFRFLNLITIIFFIFGTFCTNEKISFFCSIVALNILQYETFYLFYDKYRLHMFSFMNQFLICSSLFVYSLILFFHIEYLLLFIYIGFLLTAYSAYLFFHIKMRFYKIYFTIFTACIIMYAILFNYVFFNKSIAYVNLWIESFYVFALVGVIASFIKRKKIEEDARPIKEDLKILITDFSLLKLKAKAESNGKDIDEYLEYLLREKLEK